MINSLSSNDKKIKNIFPPPKENIGIGCVVGNALVFYVICIVKVFVFYCYWYWIDIGF